MQFNAIKGMHRYSAILLVLSGLQPMVRLCNESYPWCRVRKHVQKRKPGFCSKRPAHGQAASGSPDLQGKEFLSCVETYQVSAYTSLPSTFGLWRSIRRLDCPSSFGIGTTTTTQLCMLTTTVSSLETSLSLRPLSVRYSNVGLFRFAIEAG